MKAARRRISGIGEFVKEWKRSSAARTRFGCESDDGLVELKPVCANADENRFEIGVWAGRASSCLVVREFFPETERRCCCA
jgi:hypothetical protein